MPAEYQHRVLFWGILGALVLRAVFILAGAALLDRFHWMIYVFGAFLVDHRRPPAVQERGADRPRDAIRSCGWCAASLPVTPTYQGQRFLVPASTAACSPRRSCWSCVVIEATDVVFAVDSIPAIFAVTQDPFIVFTSNIFAILGLRSLYFLLADFMGRFHYLHYGLGLVLAFVGAKMVASAWVKIPVGVSLAVIVGLLAASVAASFLFPPTAPPPPQDEA